MQYVQTISRSQKLSCLIGNLIEHYDTALYALLMPFIGHLFFPNDNPLLTLLMTYVLIPLGMMARPLGALAFGFLAKKLSQAEVLFLSLTGMGITSFLIGITPTYEEIGYFAPLVLFFGRLFQNFFSIGESIGGALYLLDGTQEKKHNLISSFYSSSTIIGILLASLLVSIFSSFKIIETYWRVLFFLGSSTAFFGMYLRQGINSFPLHLPFASINPFKAIFNNKRIFFTLAIVSGFSYASFTIALSLTNGLLPFVTSATKEEMVYLNTSLLFLDFLLLPFFGYIADRFGALKIMKTACLLTIFLSFPAFYFLKEASFSLIILTRIFFVIIGVSFSAPFYSWVKKITPIENQFTLIAFSYAVGTQIFGGPTAALSLLTFQKTGILALTALYWVLLALITYRFLKKLA